MVRRFDMSAAMSRDEGIAEASAAIRRGALVGMPTETVYGLAADAMNPLAVARIFEAKGRPRFNPLIVHVADISEAGRLADLGPAGEALAAAFWPGPLTIVAKRRPGAGIAELATAGLPTIALRAPSHPVAKALIAATGRPLAAPSANRSGHVSATAADHVIADLGSEIEILLDAGPTAIGLESTIVAIDGPPRLLRLGAIAPEKIEAVLGRPLLRNTGAAIAAPGMLASHYAPNVPLRLNATVAEQGESLLAFGPVTGATTSPGGFAINLSPTGDIREAAAKLFGALRLLEERGQPIAAMPIPDVGLGAAINDRLRRAAAPRG
jgi:L-threonylcarbamoyladenylate synthase